MRNPRTTSRLRHRTVDADDIAAVPIRHPWRWLLAAVALVLVGLLAVAVATNKNIDWSAVRGFQFDAAIRHGFLVTLELTGACMAVGVLLGTVLAVMRLSANPVLSSIAAAYIWFIRGTPVLVQLLFWYNLGLLFPSLGIGGLSVNTNTVISGFTAAVLGLGLNEAAYMAEVVRAGIISVEAGQTEAALALGLTGGQTLRSIVLPQAMRVIIPPTGNQLISLLKTTSLVAFIAGGDLLTVSQNIYSRNFLVIELLIVASAWYLLATTIANVGQHFLERRFARGLMGEDSRAGGFLRRRVLAGTQDLT